MNVLVYSGPEILPGSLDNTIKALRSILLSHYTVQPLTQHSLTTQPWTTSCALLVLPQCRNQDGFVSVASKKIQDYVESGGVCLMLGTGASVIPRTGLGGGIGSISFGLETQENPIELPLRFHDKLNKIDISFDTGGNQSGDASDPHFVVVRSPDGNVVRGVYDPAASSRLTGFDDIQGVSTLARYGDEGDQGVIAALTLDINIGKIALWCPSIERPINDDTSKFSAGEIKGFERSKRNLLRNTLSKLRLQVPSNVDDERPMSRPLPQFLTSIPGKPTIVSQIIDALASPQSGSQLSVYKDANDEFHFHPLQESAKLLQNAREESNMGDSDPATWQPKHVVVCPGGTLPGRELTPLFDLTLYYDALSTARDKAGADHAATGDLWGLGEALIYGEAVTSTQSMLDKNPRLLSTLPTPLLSLASHQLAGRGRGSNIWLSPSGCLQFSILLRVSLSPTTFPANKLVFIQYLFALAVVEACRDDTVLGKMDGEKVRLKWPNDLYADVGSGGREGKEDLRKIGGVLVNTSFSGGKVDIVVGCGLNVLNPPPITSLSQLQSEKREKLSMECTAAAIMTKFESMWGTFIQGKGSFAPFMDLYLKRWLHSDQLVTLTTTTPHTMVRITGITPDHGLLRTVPERRGMGRSRGGASEGEYIDLQPDGNSFDLMANLIKSKS
ncbi:hypothetical protein B0H34DRAFT_800303 [Crassisporium funariophilum]|nr:hypothetical protein B0H34DRAFT_800303 [Crassisporium funariophilum]